MKNNTKSRASTSRTGTRSRSGTVSKQSSSPAVSPVLQESLLKLRSLLKLPKARRWVYCEFFYPDIDCEIFLAEDNEFAQCLKEAFPSLRTRLLRKTEWKWIRRMIGKPRRCSATFLAEERLALASKRMKIRQIYAGTKLVLDPEEDYDLPVVLPEGLKTGTRVVVRLREKARDGLFLGTINSLATSKADIGRSFNIVFDKESIPSRPVYDIDIVSLYEPLYLPLSDLLEKNRVCRSTGLDSFGDKKEVKWRPSALGGVSDGKGFRSFRKNALHYKNIEGSPANRAIASFLLCVDMKPDPMFSNEPDAGPSNHEHSGNGGVPDMGMLRTVPVVPRTFGDTALSDPEPNLDPNDVFGNFPTKFLLGIVKLNKLLKIKKYHIQQLKAMNSEAERLSMFVDTFPKEFQLRYAEILLNLESVNRLLEHFMNTVAEFCSSLYPELSVITVASRPESLKKLALSRATQIVRSVNGKYGVQSRGILTLISNLVSTLLQIKSLAGLQARPFEISVLGDSLKELSELVDERNQDAFQDHVEVHVSQVKSRMSLASERNLSSFIIQNAACFRV